ncbi:MAG: acylhydrolase [Bacteroidales bacterium]|nr:acylhydrolase [Bacteroidales bacterium]
MSLRNTWPLLLVGALLLASCRKDPASELPPPEPPQALDTRHKGPVAVFIGDSITWQWERQGVGHPVFFSSNNYVNKGISGNKTSDMLARFKADVVDLDPHCVVIEGGTNDVAAVPLATILERLKKMAEMAQEADIPVIIGAVPPSNSFPKVPGFRPQDYIPVLNGMIKTWADQAGIPYADYYAVLVDEEQGLKKEYQKDSIHPNAEGYTAMEKVISPILKKVLDENAKK